MSLKARTTVVMLVVLLIVYGWYLIQILMAASTAPVVEIPYQWLLLVTVGILVVLSVVDMTVLAILARREADQEDDRDNLIEMRSDQVGGYVLAVAAFAAIGVAMVEGSSFWIAQLLLAGLVLSELVKSVVMLGAYRRGF